MTMTFTRSERISHLKTRIIQLNESKKKVGNPIVALLYDKVIDEFEQEIEFIENSNDEYIVVEV